MALKWKRVFVVALLALVIAAINLTLAPKVFANIEAFEFNDSELRERYQDLAVILRCPKCQNQNIVDSDAPIAADLRQQVYRLLNEGYSDDEILEFMVARYGNFVLYEPPVNPLTYLLWFGPFGLLLLAAVVVFLLLRGNKKAAKDAQQLSDQDRERLNKLLNK
ncbi:cytochrome c-type biogenesis protein [Oceanospirillum maris]|jgi:cytochrome c-type biogenesis protein CcmH|uniref:cytochrome c-type biogenesis protein n=1 Tax=Oceanospirillum maris TaxID=64977 RepID=UPI0004247243|nr:cytochrome c-type biogenesis protein [Oceanospirillum maris]